MVAGFALLHLKTMGSLTQTGISLLCSMALPLHEFGCGPFTSTKDCMMSFIQDHDGTDPGIGTMRHELRAELLRLLVSRNISTFDPSFRLIHRDLDMQKLMFACESPNHLPQFLAVIDFDYSFARHLSNVLAYLHPLFAILIWRYIITGRTNC